METFLEWFDSLTRTSPHLKGAACRVVNCWDAKMVSINEAMRFNSSLNLLEIIEDLYNLG